ncbi:unnamed protein product [Choristocarpus tenellus]
MGALWDTLTFYRCMFYFLFGGSYASCPYFIKRPQARVQCYSLALIFYLWSKPHYRSGSFREDMVKNLRNVAIPGTGVPLSVWCYFKLVTYVFVLGVNPVICLIGALWVNWKYGRSWASVYTEQLLCPQDWFSFWRLNCRLASYHALHTGSQGYSQEDKWTFLTEAKKNGVPISPFLDVPELVIKDKDEEGGMGLFFYKNATIGGSWIIQERLHNSNFISSLLPDGAPLSTMRVITASRWWIEKRTGGNPGESSIKPLSCVFRAGRKHSLTDHSSILFDVNSSTGKILMGTTNDHWYQLGLDKIFKTQWVSSHNTTHHPDNNMVITGETIPDIAGILSLVTNAHFKLLPDVLLVGWDVALTSSGVLLLEVNLSCNFFRGSFDQQKYISFVNDCFLEVEKDRIGHGKRD